jgi:hypothetical protein
LVPVYNTTPVYVPEFNNYYSDISKICPILRPQQEFVSEYFTPDPTDVLRNWKTATFATSDTAVPVIIAG